MSANTNCQHGPRAATIALALLFCSALGAAAQTPEHAGPASKDAPLGRVSPTEAGATGIWKAVVPPVKMNGAFDDHDPIGLAAGKAIPADCSLNWTDPDSGRLYCFSSATSLVYFLNAPQAYIARATKGWRELKNRPST